MWRICVFGALEVRRAEEKLFQAEKVIGGLVFGTLNVRLRGSKVISGGKGVWQIGFLRTLGVPAEE